MTETVYDARFIGKLVWPPHMIAEAIKQLEESCPTEWVDVRVRLQEAYEACPADGT